MNKDSKIYVAGHRGMVGSAIVRELQRQGYTNIITRTHKELDLNRQYGPNGTPRKLLDVSKATKLGRTYNTTNMTLRAKEHSEGLCSYTSTRLPVKLVYTEEYETLNKARHREMQIKGWSR